MLLPNDVCGSDWKQRYSPEWTVHRLDRTSSGDELAITRLLHQFSLFHHNLAPDQCHPRLALLDPALVGGVVSVADVVGGGEARRELSLAEYSDSVFKNFRRLAEEVSELIAVYSLPVEDAYDIDFDKAQEEGRDVDPLIQKDFDLIQKLDGQLNDLKTSEDSRGGVDPQMILNTVAGHILRRIFRENFYHTTFVDYAREMKKHMTKWLAGEGLSPGAVRYFSKMFNAISSSPFIA